MRTARGHVCAGGEQGAGAADDPAVRAIGLPGIEPLKLAGHQGIRQPVGDFTEADALVHPGEDAAKFVAVGLISAGSCPGRRWDCTVGIRIAGGVDRLAVVVGGVACLKAEWRPAQPP